MYLLFFAHFSYSGSQTAADREKMMASFEEGEEIRQYTENLRHSQKIQEELEAIRRAALVSVEEP